MKTIPRLGIALTIISLLLFGSTLQAKHHQMDEESMQEMHQIKSEQSRLKAEERLLRLKAALNLKQEQMPAWNEYERHILESSQKRQEMMSSMHKRRMANKKPPNGLQMAEMNVQRLEHRLENAKQKLKVFKTLYNRLDEQQRQTVDKLSHRMIRKKAKALRGK